MKRLKNLDLKFLVSKYFFGTVREFGNRAACKADALFLKSRVRIPIVPPLLYLFRRLDEQEKWYQK